MSFHRTIFFTTAIILMAFSPICAGESEELKGQFERVVEELNQRDLEGFLSHWHREAVFYLGDYMFPVDLTEMDPADWAQIWKDFFAATREITFTPVDLEYRVLDNIGMVWGLGQLLVDPLQGPSFSRNVRLTVTLSQGKGAWKIINWHSSPAPENNPREPRKE